MPDKAIPPFNIRGHRFGHSPFYACYATAGALLGVYAGRLYPWLLDDDPNAAYWTLRRNAVLYDVPERPIEIAGPDAERLLGKALTRDMAKLRVGRAAYGLACLPDGGILMDGIVMRLGPERFWYVQADGAFFPGSPPMESTSRPMSGTRGRGSCRSRGRARSTCSPPPATAARRCGISTSPSASWAGSR